MKEEEIGEAVKRPMLAVTAIDIVKVLKIILTKYTIVMFTTNLNMQQLTYSEEVRRV